MWNHDSSILCIQCTDSQKNCLLFLSCTNYAWQIKKWMTIDHQVITAKWFPDNSLQLITTDGIYYSLHLSETLCTSSPKTLDWVAVIDHCKNMIFLACLLLNIYSFLNLIYFCRFCFTYTVQASYNTTPNVWQKVNLGLSYWQCIVFASKSKVKLTFYFILIWC